MGGFFFGIAGNRKRGNFDVGTYCIQKYEFEISEANFLRVARREEAESEVFFERTPLGLCELSTSTYNLGQEGPKE